MWCGLYSGKCIDLANPRPEDIEIRDIAWSLAHTIRFNGHLEYQISVAQHSICVAQLVPAHLRLAALLHDALEAYLGDIVRPVKRFLQSHGVDIDELEDEWKELIWRRFECTPKTAEDRRVIAAADDLQLASEIFHFAPAGPFKELASLGASFPLLTPQAVNPIRGYEAFMFFFRAFSR